MALKLSELRAGMPAFRLPPVPDLGLIDNPAFPLGVYVLSCEGGCFYVGIALEEKVISRITVQFSDDGSDFCNENRPALGSCLCEGQLRVQQ